MYKCPLCTPNEEREDEYVLRKARNKDDGSKQGEIGCAWIFLKLGFFNFLETRKGSNHGPPC